jgi:cytoskeletal protein RodZ
MTYQRRTRLAVLTAILIVGFSQQSLAAKKTTKPKKRTIKSTKSTTKVPTTLAPATTEAPATTTTTTTAPAPTITTVEPTTLPPTTVALSPAARISAQIRQNFASKNPVVIEANGSSQTIDCAGRPLVVRGDTNQVIAKNCAPVLIDGSSNIVNIDVLVPGLAILGNQNGVAFKAGEPNGISIVGDNNRVGPG